MFSRGRATVLCPKPLRLLTPTCVASAAVAIGASISSDCLLQPFFEKSSLQRAVGALMAALFGIVGTRWALSREPSDWNALRGSAMTGAVVLAWFTLCDRLAAMHGPGAADSLATLLLPILLVVVAAIGAMVGTLFGLTAVAVVRPVERSRSCRSLDAPERVLLPASVWLCAWGLTFIALRHPRCLGPVGLVGVGLAGLGFVIVRDIARIRWLFRLHHGQLPTWRLATSPLRAPPAFLPSYGPYTEPSLDGLITPITPGGGPYRAVPPSLPIARVPLSLAVARAPLYRRIAWSVALTTAIVATVAIRLDPACLSF